MGIIFDNTAIAWAFLVAVGLVVGAAWCGVVWVVKRIRRAWGA